MKEIMELVIDEGNLNRLGTRGYKQINVGGRKALQLNVGERKQIEGGREEGTLNAKGEMRNTANHGHHIIPRSQSDESAIRSFLDRKFKPRT